MDWSDKDLLLLVDLVRRRPCLYDKNCESYQNIKLKMEVGRELATIISSTRPGTTVEDVFNVWERLCSEYVSFYKKVLSKKKASSKPLFIDKMGFMKQHLDHKLKKRVPKEKANIGNEDTTTELGPEMNGGLVEGKEKLPCLALARMEMSHNDETSEEENGSVGAEINRGSISAISIHSDDSPAVKEKLTPQTKLSRKRNHSAVSLATTVQDVSCFTLGSPLVNVSDSILDRTEPYSNEYQTYRNDNSSFASKGTMSPNEDEDHLYVKYIACKLKKLEGSQKLDFKLKLEKLFYESMNQ